MGVLGYQKAPKVVKMIPKVATMAPTGHFGLQNGAQSHQKVYQVAPTGNPGSDLTAKLAPRHPQRPPEGRFGDDFGDVFYILGYRFKTKIS